jgi:ribosomal protein S12 methylthiotransferase
MLGLLALDGYQLVDESSEADLAIVNTCGFIEAARQESLTVIRELLERKKQGQLKGVVVAGCLAEREREHLLEVVPEVDHVVGVFGREEIVRVAERLLGGLDEQRTLFRPAPVRALDDTARFRITPRHLAYLKVSEGCDRLCTFCAIPSMRGKHATKPIEEVVREAQELANDGVRELILVAQDMTYYGLDLYGEPRLAELLRALESIEPIRWIRLMYNYPQYFTDGLIATIAGSKKVIPYLDMPIQHISDRMLRLMNRRHTRQETEELITRLRSEIPGLVLRSTVIVGSPGETEVEFQELLDFVELTRFERLGAFTYSYEADTPSARLPGHVADEIKNERRDRLMQTQQEIAFAFNQTLVGRQLPVLIDAPLPKQKGVWIGRTYADAPDIDGLVFVASKDLAAGDLVDCVVESSEGYDLVARVVAGASKPRRKAREKTPSTKTMLPILE